MSFKLLDLTFSIGQVKITPLFWALCLAFVVSSFSMWRRLIKEDFREEEIFSLNLFMLLSGIALARLTWVAVGVAEIGAVTGILLIVIWRLKSSDRNVWEGLDTLSQPMIYTLIFVGVGLFLSNGNFFSLFYTLVGITGLFLYSFLKTRYRRFSWYKSGKTGFLFWAISFYVSLSLLILDFFIRGGLYWSKLFWTAWLVVSVLVIYLRSKE